MSTCISRHGEYGSHELTGVGAERFVCQWCGVLDEDGMLAALSDAESALGAALARIAAVEAERDALATVIANEAQTLRAFHVGPLAADNPVDAAYLADYLDAQLGAALAASPTPTGPEPAIDEPKHGYHADGRGVDTKNCLVCYLAVRGPGPATPTEPTKETPK